MLISLTGKIVITAVTLAVVAGLAVTIVLVVQGEADGTPSTTTASPGPEATTTPDGTEDTPSPDMLYSVGVGIADITGPIVEITFMGYAEVSQRGGGLHTRQFARSFIFERDGTRFVLVTTDLQSVGIAVRRQVVQNLQDLYGDVYSLRNVIVSGQHTHSTPGGYLVDFLLDISILGFSSESYNAYVDGITRSIVRAHENMVPSRLFFGQTHVLDAHMNRSPYSYTFNPAEERERYESDTDTLLSQIRIVKSDGSLHGVLNWFAIHTTSINMTNLLVSSDNLGYSAITLEKALNPELPVGKPEIVAGFFASNLGDVSPNTRGARCGVSGAECDNHFLLCDLGERCYSLGPGDDMYQSAKIVGHAVYEGAMDILNSPGEELTGELGVVHQFVSMPEEVVASYDPIARQFNLNDPVQGCVPAMGYSFASGTIDGANTLNITQGTIVGNPLLDTISGVLAEPTEEDVACHAPKPILLATGQANFPIPWHPRVVSISLINLAGVVIAGIPGEPTTMAGRRVRDVISDAINIDPAKVLISGLTNEYIHYVCTFEEYEVQRYEAASTIYGPHTLEIFLNKFAEFARVSVEGGEVPAGPEPEDYRDRTISLILPVVFDGSPIGRSFGDVVEQPPATVRPGEVVSATFIAANPRNDLKQESSHATVERLELGQWTEVANDANWETKFYWQRTSTITGSSQATFEWEVPADVLRTSYRIRYYGASRNILGTITQFEGASDIFTIED